MLLYTDVAFEGEGSHIPPQAALLALSTVAFDVRVFSPMAGGGYGIPFVFHHQNLLSSC